MNKIRQVKQHVVVNSGITELVIANATEEHVSVLMPMIAYLSKSSPNRWLTWVAAQHFPRDFLESFGVDTRFVRLIHCSDDESRAWITAQALSAGNSHTVIASPGKLTEKELKQFELAAHQGHCQGLLLRVR